MLWHDYRTNVLDSQAIDDPVNDPETPGLLSTAVDYARRGLAVVPNHPRQKRPWGVAAPGGVLDGTSDVAQVRSWWECLPTLNIGIACGPSRLVVIDIDVKGGAPGMDTWRDLRQQYGAQLCEETWTVETPSGGLHLYYAAPDGFRAGGSLGSGIDVQADGAQVLAPPSIHPDYRDGPTYAWALGHSPDECALAPLPDPLRELLQAAPAGTTPPPAPPRAATGNERKAQLALRRLSHGRCDDYYGWLHVGMALSALGDAGLAMWDTWSQQSPRYEPGACAEKWATFTPGHGLGLGSLIAWANDDDPPPPEPPPSGLPRIVVSERQLRDTTHEAQEALLLANDPPEIFLRAGGLVRVERDEKGAPFIRRLRLEEMRDHLTRAADFVRLDRNGNRIPVSPPLDLTANVLAAAAHPFPILEGLTETPFIRPDGTICSAAGYDPATRVYCALAPSCRVTVPAAPSADDVAAARALLEEAVCDFPFIDDASKAGALAAMITPVVRPMVDGLVPLAILDKPQAGSGATLLAKLVATVATGRDAELVGLSRDDESLQKLVTAMLLAGQPIITFDNVTGAVHLPALARALTASVWRERLLGLSETVALPQRAVWLLTGNNVRVAGDMARRCYWVRLDPETARPWQRKGFRHPDLLRWVRANRGAILTAALTLARAWAVAGRPEPREPSPPLGGYEAWREVVGGILAFAGVSGFLANVEQLYEEIDDDAGAWDAFLAAWRQAFGDTPTTAAEVNRALPSEPILKEALPPEVAEAAPNSLTRVLGNQLRQRVGRVYPSGLRVRRGKEQQRAVCWIVELVPARKSELQESCESSLHVLGTKKDSISIGREGEMDSLDSPNSPSGARRPEAGYRGPATWHGEDFDRPVTIVADFGLHEGELWFHAADDGGGKSGHPASALSIPDDPDSPALSDTDRHYADLADQEAAGPADGGVVPGEGGQQR